MGIFFSKNKKKVNDDNLPTKIIEPPKKLIVIRNPHELVIYGDFYE
jgi:hypothetical protein